MTGSETWPLNASRANCPLIKAEPYGYKTLYCFREDTFSHCISFLLHGSINILVRCVYLKLTQLLTLSHAILTRNCISRTPLHFTWFIAPASQNNEFILMDNFAGDAHGISAMWRPLIWVRGYLAWGHIPWRKLCIAIRSILFYISEQYIELPEK